LPVSQVIIDAMLKSAYKKDYDSPSGTVQLAKLIAKKEKDHTRMMFAVLLEIIQIF
jgi:hypothetical protein